MAKDAGLSLETYRYYDKKTVGLDFAGMMQDIKVRLDRDYAAVKYWCDQ
jgi:aspartate aminotransferase